jgi:hypothetical protein
MLEDTKFWAGFIMVFVLVDSFVTGLLVLMEWLAKHLDAYTVNPIYLATGGACAFYACVKMHDNERKP